ncbi:hypothetical protein JCM8115_000429 [Rhodotorula mucilaginosa]|uniref:Uncharacterized protein n=1 Tax=Rhodotorula mucilaginosa TaxID=5537 RepID=A0A9P7B2S1_RHOMI|nr:hypothetical protein C6P46_001017 [Rhodotorula mucilaginosa]TKA53531.1 hypothetical protein B0A53_03822 [Rhodotorula sp. CCFEE 5036]
MSTTNTNATSTSSGAGADLGNRAGGVFNALHGAGEAIRGNINSFLDQGGDAVAGREHGTVPSRDAPPAGHETTAQSGVSELKKGISEIQGKRA